MKPRTITSAHNAAYLLDTLFQGCDLSDAELDSAFSLIMTVANFKGYKNKHFGRI